MLNTLQFTPSNMPKVPSIVSTQAYKRPFWCIDCTPLCTESRWSGITFPEVHHDLILSLMTCSNTYEIENTDFKKCLDKYATKKWLHSGCVASRRGKPRLPLVHWVCILGKYRILEYLVKEKGFNLSLKIGRNKEGPLHSMIRHLSSSLNPRSSTEYVGNIFLNVFDVFLRYTPEVLSEKDGKTHDTLLHFLARRCNMNPCSRLYLHILLVKIKEIPNIPSEKKDEILSAVNKRGNTFLHLVVSDDSSANTVTYFLENFATTAQRLSKTWNILRKTPRQIAVEKRCFAMLRALGAPDAVFNSLSRGLIMHKEE